MLQSRASSAASGGVLSAIIVILLIAVPPQFSTGQSAPQPRLVTNSVGNSPAVKIYQHSEQSCDNVGVCSLSSVAYPAGSMLVVGLVGVSMICATLQGRGSNGPIGFSVAETTGRGAPIGGSAATLFVSNISQTNSTNPTIWANSTGCYSKQPWPAWYLFSVSDVVDRSGNLTLAGSGRFDYGKVNSAQCYFRVPQPNELLFGVLYSQDNLTSFNASGKILANESLYVGGSGTFNFLEDTEYKTNAAIHRLAFSWTGTTRGYWNTVCIGIAA
jgi:hypothetical protein